MLKKKWSGMIALALSFAMIFMLASNVTPGLTAYAVTQDEIDALQEQADSLASQKAQVQSEIASLEDDQNTTLAKKEVLDEQVMLTQQQIDNIEQQIEAYAELIEEKEQEVIEDQQREDEQLEEYRSRVESMEANGSISYLAVLFEASSFSDFLSRLDFISEVMKYDEQLYQDYIAAKEATIAAKEELEDAKAAEEAAKADEEDKKAELEEQVQEAQDYIAELEDSIGESEAYYDELDASQAAIAAEIAEKEAELAAQKAAEEAARKKAEEEAAAKEAAEKKAAEEAAQQNSQTTTSSSGSSSFIWPTPSCYGITSDYGYRYHPLTGIYKLHAGIDIGASYGASILASASGTVLNASYDSGYGNYITISHGNGYTTVYAHMSAFAVSAGDYVSQGQVIGYVGSTGASTGPHCHFEVYYNGSLCDPLDYLSGYSYFFYE